MAQVHTIRDPYCKGLGQPVDLSGPFDCIGTIAIGECGRSANVDARAGRVWKTSTPALVLDAAWRAAVAGVTGTDDLFVPTQTGRLILSIQTGNEQPGEGDRPWTIRSTRPQITGDEARWERTEVLDSQGKVKLVVENGGAKQMG